MSKPTRKSIGDENGVRSVYVVEAYLGGWIPYWRAPFCFKTHSAAMKRMKEVMGTHKEFRVSLYVRAEAQ